jgi:hypothetical protein
MPFLTDQDKQEYGRLLSTTPTSLWSVYLQFKELHPLARAQEFFRWADHTLYQEHGFGIFDALTEEEVSLLAETLAPDESDADSIFCGLDAWP